MFDETPKVGDIWAYKGKHYRIEKFLDIRTKDGWVTHVNYIPLVPLPDAPNDYGRTLEDFHASGFNFVSRD